MRKLFIICMFGLLAAPISGHATLWTYSGISQESYSINGATYDVYISMTISDRLYDFFTNQYVELKPGDLIPPSGAVGFRITEAYIDIIGVEQISASGSVLGHTWDHEPIPGLLIMDEIVLSSKNDWYGLLLGYHGWEDDQGNYWNYYDPASPTYGQLAPVISAGGYHPLNFRGGFTFVRSPSSATQEPVPEPATLLLSCIGILGLGFLRKKQNKV